MKSEFSLLYAIAVLQRARITKQTIRSLKTFGREVMLSGDDSGLKNIWEEICVQFQWEESFHWDAYEDLIQKVILGILEKEPRPIIELLAYIGLDDYSEEYENLVLDLDGAMQFVKEELYEEAANFQNGRIKRYLDRNYNDEF